MSGIAPARLAAYSILRAVNTGRSDLPDAVAGARSRLQDERDRALAAEVAAGTLRWMGALDAVAAAFTGRELRRLDPEVVDILRLGAYQLLHLERVPASAVVNDSVALAKARGKGSASGLVNAVLRRVDRERGTLPLPPRPREPETDTQGALDYLSVTLSHPRWLAARLLGRLGFDGAEAWLRFDNSPAPLTLRANTLLVGPGDLAKRLLDYGVETRPSAYSAFGLVVTGGQPLRTPAEVQALFVVQDEASQLVADFAAAAPRERVLDACAAPGGKTIAIAGDMRGDGLLVAAELRPRRVALLSRSLLRAGANRVKVVRADASAEMPYPPVFDLVLLDAPCSGLGTVRRDPEIRWRRKEPDLPVLAGLQLRMLQRASAAVAPGGRLIYSTCSSEPDENDAVVESFLGGGGDFSLADPAETGFHGRVPPTVVDSRGLLRTFPHLHGLEAFFAAKLRRR
jgi:16S rRNA (cytosine967-C5)-methyltransferase